MSRQKREVLPPLTDEPIAPATERLTIQTGKKISILARLSAGERVTDIAKREGVTLAVIRQVRDDPHLKELMNEKAVEKTKEMMSNRFYLASDALLNEAMKPEKLAKMRTTEGMMAAGIAIDKARLLEGKSTDNLSIRGVVGHLKAQLTDVELMRKHILDSMEGGVA